jgi:hypothetical protein
MLASRMEKWHGGSASPGMVAAVQLCVVAPIDEVIPVTPPELLPDDRCLEDPILLPLLLFSSLPSKIVLKQ